MYANSAICGPWIPVLFKNESYGALPKLESGPTAVLADLQNQGRANGVVQRKRIAILV